MWRSTVIALCCLLMPGGTVPAAPQTQKAAGTVTLDPRIGPPDRERNAERWVREWKNPRVVVDSEGTYILRSGATFGEDTRPVADLARSLSELPLTDWPEGRIVALTTTPRANRRLEADPSPAHPTRLALDRTREVLRNLGVEIIETPVGCNCGGSENTPRSSP